MFDEPDLTGIYRVDSDGFVAFPLINKIEAGGLTLTEFEQRLKARLAAGFLNNPQVRVDIEAYKSQFIFVGGEVRAPNRHSVVRRDDAARGARPGGIADRRPPRTKSW